MLIEIWRQLRVARDPAAALALLDLHAVRFPRGSFGPEARIARVEALMALGRNAAARSLVEGTGLDVRSDLRLRVIRAELRAQAGDTAAALDDFSIASRQAGAPTTVARALFGLAVCQAKLGHRDQAEASYRLYLRRFPNGRDAMRARAALEAARPSP